ncbi:hypothetical protein ACF07B_26100 [Streptomyces sp. NPDC015532]|uniref:hypothetical protein n=1 Tax=Streptomyces sp. NPDC015532 TaxID=3364960 RepID=UPI0036F79AB7
MIRRLLARHRLEISYHPAWVSHPAAGRARGPRSVVAVHRLPDPLCPYCGGDGEVEYGSPGAEEPEAADCPCSPFLPLAFLWLPNWPRWARQRWVCPACGARSHACPCFTDPPF